MSFKISYLLIDQKLVVVVLDGQLPLHVLKLGPLREDLMVNVERFCSCHFSLLDHVDQAPGIFQFLAQTAQFFCALRISSTSLARLSYFSPTETHVWITFIGLATSLEL